MTDAVLTAADLRVERLGRRGARFELVVDALALAAGEALAILGPNGAGKTTLLRALAGVDKLESGRVEARVEPIGLVLQHPVAFAGTVAHNVRTGLIRLRLGRHELDTRLGQALARFDIAHLAERNATRLSGGELRRMALARAFAAEPAVLLLDEPFDDLDTRAQEKLSADLRRVIRETHTAVAFVTHDLRRAALLADRVAVLIGGRIAQVGARDAVLTHPGNASVAALVGMSNRLPGQVAAGNRIELDGGGQMPVVGAPPEGARVVAGLRPEHLKLDVDRGVDGVRIGRAEVVALYSDGQLVIAELDWAGHVLRAHLLAGRGLARELKVGDRVGLAVRPEDVRALAPD